MERDSQTRNLPNDRRKMKRYHEPKFRRNERKVIEERLQQLINNWTHGDLRQRIGLQNKGVFQPQTGHSEQWKVDPFWGMDRPTPFQQSQFDKPGPSSAPIPMEEGEIDTETDQDPSVLKVPAFNWAQYVGVKSVQYVKMGRTTQIAAKNKMIGT